MFDGKRILITGGTGSLGRALTEKLLESDVKNIRILSREEWKQEQMREELNDKRLRFLIGDVRDKERLEMALEDIDIVFHAAALKHVHIAEYNPFEAVKTNVYGTQNLIDACLEKDVKTAIAIGTDKAVSALNTYGATKLLMERLFVSADYYKGNHKIKFICVRYGNVLGSRGSLVPKIISQINEGKKITITDPNMTRFNITMKESLELILRAFKHGTGGEVFIPKLKAYKVGDMKDAIIEQLQAKNEIENIPIRPGEKNHEILINKDELRNAYETEHDYIVFEKELHNHDLDPALNAKKIKLTDQFSSERVDLLTKEELKEILLKEKLIHN